MGNRQLGEFLKELENEVENLKSQIATSRDVDVQEIDLKSQIVTSNWGGR